MEENKHEVAIVPQGTTELNMFGSITAFEAGQRMAKVFATSTLVPESYHNNIGNCMIALNLAQRMKSDPLMVMQNLVIVHNKPTFEAKFAIACFNATRKYSPIRYKEIGEKGKDSYGMYAYAFDLKDGTVLKGPEITIKLAKGEGWYQRNKKWETMPELMLRYRSASWFIRTTDPGVMMGFQTKDEVEDVEGVEVPIDTPTGIVTTQEPEVVDIDTQIQSENSDTAEQIADAEPEKNEQESKPVEQPDNGDYSKQDKEPMGKQPTPDRFKYNLRSAVILTPYSIIKIS